MPPSSDHRLIGRRHAQKLKKGDGVVQVFNQFRIIWADHGDDISRQYAGTGALKSGFTRTGPGSLGFSF